MDTVQYSVRSSHPSGMALRNQRVVSNLVRGRCECAEDKSWGSQELGCSLATVSEHGVMGPGWDTWTWQEGAIAAICG